MCTVNISNVNKCIIENFLVPKDPSTNSPSRNVEKREIK